MSASFFAVHREKLEIARGVILLTTSLRMIGICVCVPRVVFNSSLQFLPLADPSIQRKPVFHFIWSECHACFYFLHDYRWNVNAWSSSKWCSYVFTHWLIPQSYSYLGILHDQRIKKFTVYLHYVHISITTQTHCLVASNIRPNKPNTSQQIVIIKTTCNE